MLVTAILSVLTIGSAALDIHAEYTRAKRQEYLFKPLTIILIFCIALLAPVSDPPLYKTLILAGLALSLAADVLLMLPKDYFLPGLGGFLLAHLSYIAAFSVGRGLHFSWWWVAPGLIYAGIIRFFITARLRWMQAPVLAYMLVILLMAGQAWERYARLGTTGTLLAGLGALLFIISDSALALGRFRRHYRHQPLAVLGTYFTAQLLIALSVGLI